MNSSMFNKKQSDSSGHSNEPTALQKLYRIFSRQERHEIVILFVISFFSAVVQSSGVISVMPFINIIMNMDALHQNKWLNAIYNFGKFNSDIQFVIVIGIAVITLLILSSALASITSWLKNRFVLKRNFSLSRRLLSVYLHKPYEYFLLNNTSELGKNILSEINNLGNLYLSNLLELIISSLLFLFLLVTLLLINFKVTILVIVFFGVTYGAMTSLFRKKLVKSGELVVHYNNERFRTANEALNSVKITKAMNLENYFIGRFTKYAEKFSDYQLFAKLIADIPNYILEGLAFSMIIGLVLIIIARGNDINSLLPVISVYAFAGYRITPALSRIFKAATTIYHNQPILNKVYADMFENGYQPIEQMDQIAAEDFGQDSDHKLVFAKTIDLQHVEFFYKNSRKILDDFSIRIEKNSIVGFAGSTGAGKTTLIDLFLGLLKPEKGGIFVDNIPIDDTNVRKWREIVGYVPQDIFLIDESIRKNIAFGVPEKEIDDKKVRAVSRIAAIAQFIEEQLPEKYETVVGERGVRLSGGQRQRIGLARALYRDPEVLILDEATSALDGTTEAAVLKGIHSESCVKTILIIAHRLNTLKICDQIYLLENGKILDQGTYDWLVSNNPKFNKMAQVGQGGFE